MCLPDEPRLVRMTLLLGEKLMVCWSHSPLAACWTYQGLKECSAQYVIALKNDFQPVKELGQAICTHQITNTIVLFGKLNKADHYCRGLQSIRVGYQYQWHQPCSWCSA